MVSSVHLAPPKFLLLYKVAWFVRHYWIKMGLNGRTWTARLHIVDPVIVVVVLHHTVSLIVLIHTSDHIA